MKKILLLFSFVFTLFNLNAQISLENKYSADYQYLRHANIEGDVKYFLQTESELIIYNLDHSILKQINIPNGYGIYYVSDSIFNLDSKIEFLATSYNEGIWRIYNEDALIIFEKDSINTIADINANSQFISPTIFATKGGMKMTINNNDGSVSVYSLPGKISCSCCESILTNTSSRTIRLKSLLSNSYPNPAYNFARIDYQLPSNVKSGIITLFDINGQEVKRYSVNKTFDHLKVNTTDMPAGTYFYNLRTDQGVSEGQKIVIKK